MKKLLLTFVALIVGVFVFHINAATTTVYVVGAGDGLDWTPPGKAFSGEDGVVTFTVNNLSSFKASRNNSSVWDGDGNYNAGCFGPASGATFGSSVYPNGQTLSMASWGDNVDLPWTGNYTITMNFNDNTITAKTSTPQPQEGPDVYIRGDMNSWGTSAAWKMTCEKWDAASNSGVYTFNGTIPAGKGFKFADSGYSTINFGGSVNASLTTPQNLVYNGGNISLSTEFTGKVTLNVTGYHVANVVLSSGDVTPSYPDNMYVIGTINGGSWAPTNVAKMEGNGEGVYTIESVTLAENGGSTGFAITGGGSSWDDVNGLRFGPSVKDGAATIGSLITDISTGDVSWSIAPGTYKMTFDITVPSLLIESESEVTYPDNLYVLGNFDSVDWDPSAAKQMVTGKDGVYTIENLEMNDGSGNAYFSFCTQPSSSFTDWVVGTRYGAGTENDVTITSGETYGLVQNADPKAFAGTAGTYSITVDLAKMEMTATWVEASEPEMAVNDFKAVSENVEETTADIVVSYTVENAPENAKYTVYYQEANGEEQSVEATATGATINLTDLTAATEYTYTVSLAVNDEKVADVEASVNFTTNNASSEEPTPEVGETIDVTFDLTSFATISEYYPGLPEASTWEPDGSNKKITVPTIGSNGGVTLTNTTPSSITKVPVIYNASEKYTERWYEGSTFTVSVPEGYALESMDFETSGTNGNINKLSIVTENVGSFENTPTKHMVWTAPEGVAINAIDLTTSGTTMISYITVKATKLPEEPGLPEFGDNTYTIYGNGVVNSDLSQENWYNAVYNFQATNPSEDSVEKVFSFKAGDTNIAAASMGLLTNGTPSTGIFHDATLNFKWYATTAATYKIRLTAIGATPSDFDYTLEIADEDLNKWNEGSFSVKEEFNELAEDWNSNINLGQGYLFSIVLENGTEESVIYFNDIYYSNVDYEWVAPKVEFPAPETVPVPETPAADVLSIYSYYGDNQPFTFGSWESSTVYDTTTIEGQDVMFLRNFNYFGLENISIDASQYDYLHVDYWTNSEDTPFGFTPISNANGATQEKTWNAETVTANEWNSYDAPLSYFTDGGVDLSSIFQMKFVANQNGGTTPYAYIANVYFWKEPAPETSFVVMGNINDDSSWKNSFEFVNYNDGIYSTEKFDKLVEFKLNDNGTWYGYDGSGYAPLNETFKVAAGDQYGNVSFGLSGYVADAVISFNPETLEVSVSGTWVSTALELYFMGAKNNWEANADYKMSTQDGKVYTLTLSDLDAGSEFKFAAANWSPQYSNGEKSLTNGTYEMTGGDNMALGKSMTNVTFTLDIDKKTLTIAGTESGFVTLYLRGSMNDWNATDDWKFNTTDGENYVLENVNIPAGATMKIANSGWEASYTYTYTEAPIALNTEYTLVNLTGDNDNMYMSVAAENATVNYNINTHEFEIVAAEVVVIPETLYLIGNINNLGFLANNTKKMEPVKDESGNVVARSFGAENVVFDNVDNTGDSYFAFCTQTGSTPDAWNELGTRYGAESRDLRIEEGNTKPLAITADNYSFMIEAGTYDILVTFDEDGNGSVKVLKAGTLGVDGIEAEGGEAEYYTLSGIKVANPIEGQIYIKVQNGKAVKIIK